MKMNVIDSKAIDEMEMAKNNITKGKEVNRQKSLRLFHKTEGIDIAKEITTRNIKEVNIIIPKEMGEKGSKARTEKLVKEYQENGVAFIIADCQSKNLGLHATATQLKKHGLKTPQGKEWGHMQVKQVRQLLDKYGDYTAYVEPEPQKEECTTRGYELTAEFVRKAKEIGLSLEETRKLLNEIWLD